MPKIVATKTPPVGKKDTLISDLIYNNNNRETVTSIQQLTPTVATTDVQYEKETANVTHNVEITLTEDEIPQLSVRY